MVLAVIYVHSVVAFAFYRKSFREEDGAFCQDLWQCFLTSVRLGLSEYFIQDWNDAGLFAKGSLLDHLRY